MSPSGTIPHWCLGTLSFRLRKALMGALLPTHASLEVQVATARFRVTAFGFTGFSPPAIDLQVREQTKETNHLGIYLQQKDQ
jgi:hypothetical protein